MLRLYNPWNFAKDLDQFFSPDGSKRVVYTDLRAVDDKGLLMGTLVLFAASHGVILSKRAGGPPVWDKTGRKVVFPVLAYSFLIGQYQRLVVVDAEEKTMTTLRRRFTLLQIEQFDGNTVKGKDIKAYGMQTFEIDLREAKTKLPVKYCRERVQLQ